MPWVLGPSTVPVVTDLQRAETNVELAVLSLIEHGRSSGVDLAVRIASAAIVASAGLDAERFKLYFDIVSCHLPEGVRWTAATTMNSFGYEYRSEFARHYVAEGKAEGRAEGRTEGQVKVVLKVLASRFGPPSEIVQARIRTATEAQLDGVVERLLIAQTLEEALGQLSSFGCDFRGLLI